MGRRLLLSIVIVLSAVTPVAAETESLVVGAKQAAPFAIKLEDGTWTGISVELWRQVAAELGVTYQIVEHDLEGLLAAVREGKIDVGLGALTITAAREAEMDFTHPMYSTGLAIAVRPQQQGGVLSTLGRIVSKEFVLVVLALLVLLASTGTLVWLAERRKNESQFGGSTAHGIGAGMWWSAVTMTTVGYGDKAPITPTGRMLALIWMFTAIIVTSLFTASITSALTVQQLESSIRGPEDLASATVATIPGSTSELYLKRRGLEYREVPDALTGLRQIADGELDAIVYDAPILQYTAKHLIGDAIEVLPTTFRRQDYGFALPSGSPLRERINRVMLAELRRDRFRALIEHYLGEPDASSE